jgi:hypothetical protein
MFVCHLNSDIKSNVRKRNIIVIPIYPKINPQTRFLFCTPHFKFLFLSRQFQLRYFAIQSFRILNCLCPFIYFLVWHWNESSLSNSKACNNSWAIHELVIRWLKTMISISLYFFGTILLKTFLFFMSVRNHFFCFVRLLLLLNICIEQNDLKWIDLTMHNCTILEQMVLTHFNSKVSCAILKITFHLYCF